MIRLLLRLIRSLAFVEREIQRLMREEYARGRLYGRIEQLTPIRPVVGEPRVMSRREVRDAELARAVERATRRGGVR